MRRFFSVFICIVLLIGVFLCGCSEKQIDRGKELKRAMDTCDSKWSQTFPKGTADFSQIADYIAGWGGNAGLDITKTADHYIVLTNPATKGMKKSPSVTMSVSVDPEKLRSDVPLLSLGMTSLLGPLQHGRLRLIVTDSTDLAYPGAEELDSKYLKCDHFIQLDTAGSDKIYTAGPMNCTGTLTCSVKRRAPQYGNAFRIAIHIPEQIDPYAFEQGQSLPSPVNVVGDLLASAKSSGRLFEIASFTAKENGAFLPSDAEAVVVIDDNNVESFQKRFDKSYESFQDRFADLDLKSVQADTGKPAFTYTMEPVELPSRVLQQKASDNIISLMYTLQTGIHLQDEASGEVSAASYIRSISTKGGRFRLTVDMRSRDSASMEEMSGNYLITSGLCDVDYENTSPSRLWTCKKDSSLAAWFIASVDADDADTTYMHASECDVFYRKAKSLDIISYRFDKNHRGDAMENLLSYMTSLSAGD
ncbi:MAG: hypothetical protein IJ109_07935 [Firmicutes bacterium]|nr:hypothetical protein [Bacillota bacterium]